MEINPKGAKKMEYINLKSDKWGVETVDQFETTEEAMEMLAEYQSSHPDGYYFISSTPTQDWEE